MDQTASLLKRGWRVLQKNPAGLLAAAAWPYLGVFVAAAIARAFILRYANLDDSPTEPLALWNSAGPLTRVGIVLSYLFYISVSQSLAVAGVSVMSLEDNLGGNSTFLRALVQVGRRLFPLIALSFLVGFLTTLLASIVPLVGPFIVQTIFLPSAVVVLMLEKTRVGVFTSFRTSLGLTADALPTIIGVGIVGVGAFAAITAGLIRVRMSTGVSGVFFTFAALVSFILVVPPAIALILGVVLASSYYDRRFRATDPEA